MAQMAEAESDDEYMNLKDEKRKNEEEDGFGDGMMSLDDWTQQNLQLVKMQMEMFKMKIPKQLTWIGYASIKPELLTTQLRCLSPNKERQNNLKLLKKNKTIRAIKIRRRKDN